jgi:hypothetical protein
MSPPDAAAQDPTDALCELCTELEQLAERDWSRTLPAQEEPVPMTLDLDPETAFFFNTALPRHVHCLLYRHYPEEAQANRANQVLRRVLEVRCEHFQRS